MARRLFALGLVVCLCSVACTRDSSDSDGPTLAPTTVRLALESIASSASAGGTDGVRRSGAAPPSSGGPRITATGNQRVINGGTQSVAITADAPFTTVYVYVSGRALGLLGETDGAIAGYYEIRLPSADTSTTVLLGFPQDIPLTEFDLQFAVATAAGSVGPYVPLSTEVTIVGTGDVQVTLSWDADSDVDLHVVAPGGDEVYYGRRSVASGGELDLDSNAGCDIDGIRNENIVWPVGRAPRGVYTVRVDYWSNCGVSRTDYSVRINNGGSVQIVTGTFTGAGDMGGAGSGRTVATFERTSGPAALLPFQSLLAGPGAATNATTKKDVRMSGAGR